MLDWSQHKRLSKPNSRTRNGPKISLKNVRPQTHGSQHTQSTTTCNSIYRNSDKRSIKDLMLLTKNHNFHHQSYLSIEYKDIRIIQPKQQNFISSFFCAQKLKSENQGCRCDPKCLWTEYWLSLSIKKIIPQNRFAVSKQTEEQIRKDIERTQPNSVQFKKIYYQQALYDCLMAYARIDPEIGYVQGMNIICSVLIYHGNSLDQCILIFKFLMIGCRFRDIFLNNFKLAYELTNHFQQCLKFRCHDIYSHIIQECQINLIPFTVGWLIPMMGDIIPLNFMHLVVNSFIQKGFVGLIKIIMAIFLYLKNLILETNDQTQLMHMLSTHKLKNSGIDWEELIKSSSNIKNLPINL